MPQQWGPLVICFGLEKSWTVPEEEAIVPGKSLLPQLKNKKLAKKNQGTTLSVCLSLSLEKESWELGVTQMLISVFLNTGTTITPLLPPLSALTWSYRTLLYIWAQSRQQGIPECTVTSRHIIVLFLVPPLCPLTPSPPVCWTGGNCTAGRLQDGTFSTLSVTQSCLYASDLSLLAGSWACTRAGNRAATVSSYLLHISKYFETEICLLHLL